MRSALYGGSRARVLETLCVSTQVSGAAIKPQLTQVLAERPPILPEQEAWEAGWQLLPGHFPCASPSRLGDRRGAASHHLPHSDEAYGFLPVLLRLLPQAMKRCRGCMELYSQLQPDPLPLLWSLVLLLLGETPCRVEGPCSDTVATLAFTDHVSNKRSEATSLDGTLPGSHRMTYTTVPQPDACGHQQAVTASPTDALTRRLPN